MRRLFRGLIAPIDEMFYIGNRSGLRVGEIAGLRLSDCDFLDEAEPRLRVMYQYDGEPLKEDKAGQPKKVKWPPAPSDLLALLRPRITARRAAGSAPDDLLFANPNRAGKSYRKEYIEDCWDAARAALAGEFGAVTGMTFYEATRHSYISRNLKSGIPFQIVSESVGHSSPVVTMRYYNHFIRKEYPAAMRTGLGLGGDGSAGVLALKCPDSAGAGVSARHGAGHGAGVGAAEAEKDKGPENLLAFGPL